MNSERSKLIKELMRVGRLIDPASEKSMQETKTKSTHKTDHNANEKKTPTQQIPVLDNIVDSPYSTRDMFSIKTKSEIPIETSEVKATKISQNSENKINLEENASFSENSQLKSVVDLQELPIDELAREIVVVIEDIVSKRSGESLDDSFRDDLIDAVTLQLESWLHHS